MMTQDRRMADMLELLQSGTRIVLAAVFIFMGTLHFVAGPSRAMEQIIPPVLRRGGILSPLNLVRFTGVCELAGESDCLFPSRSSPRWWDWCCS